MKLFSKNISDLQTRASNRFFQRHARLSLLLTATLGLIGLTAILANGLNFRELLSQTSRERRLLTQVSRDLGLPSSDETSLTPGSKKVGSKRVSVHAAPPWAARVRQYGLAAAGSERIACGVYTLPASTGSQLTATQVSAELQASFPDARLWAMGANTQGQLGDGTGADQDTPVEVFTGGMGGPVAVGPNHTLAVDWNGGLLFSGNDTEGAFGNGPVDSSTLSFISSSVFTKAVQDVAVGDYHSLVLEDSGVLWAAGLGAAGQLGNGGSTSDVWVTVDTGVVKIFAGENNSFFVDKMGALYAFGENTNGELGLSPAGTSVLTPTLVSLPAGVVQVSTTGTHSLFLLETGEVYAAGLNVYGQLLDNTTTPSDTPVNTGLTGVKRVTAGLNFSAYVRNDGSLYTVGYNGAGQLGTGDTLDVTTMPGFQVEISGVVDVSTGDSHTLYLLETASCMAMGDNTYGQLGTADGVSYDSPQPVVNAINAAGVFAGGNSSFFFDRSLTGIAIEGISKVYTNSTANYTCHAMWSDGRATVVTAEAVWTENSADCSFDENNGVMVIGGSAAGQRVTVVVSYFGQTAQQTLTVEEPPQGSPLYTHGSNLYGQLGDGTSGGSRLSPYLVPLTGSQKVISVAAGLGHTLFVKEDGSVWAMGDNTYGQIGDGTNTQQDAPVQVVAAGLALAVGAGDNHSLCVMRDGSLWAWGSNDYGQLGDSTQTQRTAPVMVWRSGVVQADGGLGHSVFLLNTGSVFSTGRNLEGQHGENYPNGSDVPVLNTFVSNISEIDAGARHTLMLDDTGTIFGMGDDTLGQLGQGGGAHVVNATILTVDNVKAIAAGADHSLYATIDKTLYAAGSDSVEQLGNGTDTDYVNFTQIPGYTNVTEVLAGGTFSMFRDGTTTYAMGDNSTGQFGVAIPASSDTPIATLNSNVAAITAGDVHVAYTERLLEAVAVRGILQAYAGKNANYDCFALWDDATQSIVTDAAVWSEDAAFANIGASNGIMTLDPGSEGQSVNVSATYNSFSDTVLVNVVAFNFSGAPLKGCGSNASGQLGDNTLTDAYTPIEVDSNDVSAVSAGDGHVMYIRTDGTLWGIGNNVDGQLGLGDNSDRLIAEQVDTDVVMVSCGNYHTLYVKADGSLWAMGYNYDGQLGTGDSTSYNAPVEVVHSNVVMVQGGANHSLFMQGDDTLWGMGSNYFGQLGVAHPLNGGEIEQAYEPIKIDGGVSGIAAGQDHSLYIKTGALYGMGENSQGQLGVPTSDTWVDVPVLIQASNVTGCAAGDQHSIYLVNQSLWGMGLNDRGQLGQGVATLSEPNPVSIASNVINISCGGDYSMWVNISAELWCAGDNLSGQLGQGTPISPFYEVNPVQMPATNGVVLVGSGADTAYFTESTGGPVLVGIEVVGPSSVDENTTTNYRCDALYSDASRVDVSASAIWTQTSVYAAITSIGELVTSEVVGDWPTTISVEYSGHNDVLDVKIIDRDPMARVYVDQTATGIGNGTSWTDAFPRLENGLPKAGAGSEVWVAQGSYKPTPTTNRIASFVMPDGAKLLGGFDGTETDSLLRDPFLNVTTLSGDIGMVSDPRDNSFHVLIGSNNGWLDGFTVRDGNASRTYSAPNPANADSDEPDALTATEEEAPGLLGTYTIDDVGGGMVNFAVTGMVISNTRFIRNRAGYGGGAVYNRDSDPQYLNCSFNLNQAGRWGGAVFNTYYANAVLRDSVLDSNSSGTAGGALMSSDRCATVIERCYIRQNDTVRHGGGAIFNYSMPAIVNTVFWGNEAGEAGGAVIANDSTVNMQFCTVNRNFAGVAGAGFECNNSSLNLRGSIVYGNAAPRFRVFNGRYGSTLGIAWSCIDDTRITGSGMIYVDPLLNDPSTGDMALSASSPCRDPGSGLSMPVDIRDLARDADPDLGAYEYVLVIVSGDGDGDTGGGGSGGGGAGTGGGSDPVYTADDGGGCSVGRSDITFWFWCLPLLGILLVPKLQRLVLRRE